MLLAAAMMLMLGTRSVSAVSCSSVQVVQMCRCTSTAPRSPPAHTGLRLRVVGVKYSLSHAHDVKHPAVKHVW